MQALFLVLNYELIGPVFSKMGITLAGDAGMARDESI